MTELLPSAIFSMNEEPLIDNGIQRYEFHGYEPEVGCNINSTSEIRLNITHRLNYPSI